LLKIADFPVLALGIAPANGHGESHHGHPWMVFPLLHPQCNLIGVSRPSLAPFGRGIRLNGA
jgi:hypothetical protein